MPAAAAPEPAIRPFRQFVLKVHSRCDLACDHCYIYEHADQSWLGRPPSMTEQTVEQAVQRIADHAAKHQLSDIHVILHGGEPLLLRHWRTEQLLERLTRTVDASCTRLDLRVHSNGLLLDDEYCQLFSKFDVKVGISLDGGRAANDRHRLHRDGRSSYDQVLQALSLLRSSKYRHLYAGLLCTIDIGNDPADVYRALLDQQPPRVDLLLPHATWEAQPPGLSRPRSLMEPTRGGLADGGGEYARWLKRIYDLWIADGRPIQIRVFDSILAALHGRPSQTESLGLTPSDMLVIETDGSIEMADTLKTAYDGAAQTGFDVFHDDLDRAAAFPGFAEQRRESDGLSQTCAACPVSAVCGGGLYAHRYSAAGGFVNPSVYCADLLDTITYIRERSGSAAQTIAEPAVPTHQHTLRSEQLDELAAGYGNADTIRHLSHAQLSISRDLLAQVAARGPVDNLPFSLAWELLDELDGACPEAVDRTLGHPYTRVWAVRYLNTLQHGGAVDTGLIGHLGSLAAAAALHAGADAKLPLIFPGRGIAVPTFGFLRTAEYTGEAVIEISGDGTADVHTDHDTYRLRFPGAGPLSPLDASTPPADPRWQAAYRMESDLRHGAGLLIEDTDPYRACHGPTSDRLPPDEADRWSEELHGALAFIDAHLPAYAPGLRSGLTTVVPMVPAGNGAHRSAAARHAFGAVGAARPGDPALLALLLVHEFQHVKLGAVLDLYDLFDTSDTSARYYAPWRPDPRPLEGLYQGTYAHIAVTEFWRVRRRQLDGPARDEAETQFARWRQHTADAVEELLACTSLTPLGERFARAMGETVAPWLAEPVGTRALADARRRSLEHRTAFEQHIRAGR
jgi:uncharacterized protein